MSYFEAILRHITATEAKRETGDFWQDKRFGNIIVSTHPESCNALVAQLAGRENARLVELSRFPILEHGEWVVQAGGLQPPIAITLGGSRRLARLLGAAEEPAVLVDALNLLSAILTRYKEEHGKLLIPASRYSYENVRTFAIVSRSVRDKVISVELSANGDLFSIESLSDFSGMPRNSIVLNAGGSLAVSLEGFVVEGAAPSTLKDIRCELIGIMESMAWQQAE